MRDMEIPLWRNEASQPVAAFHITENGQEVWLQQRERTEFLQAAVSLRRYLTADPNNRTAAFADMLSGTDSITPEQFRRLALERMENTGRVTGTFDVDLDKGEFSALHIMDGWRTYRIRDVSAAACRATQKTYVSSEERWERFLDRLEGQELTADTPESIEVQGTRRLRPEDVCFEESIEEVDGVLNFYLRCQFPVDEVFGTHVETDANDDYLNIYANYDMAAGEARIERQGWVSVHDPCCGAGALLIAARNVLARRNIPETAVLYIAQDLDRTAALMCYVQLALLGCAGYVVVADAIRYPLTGHPLCPSASSEREVWYLPVYFHKVWQYRILWRQMDAILSSVPHPQPPIEAAEITEPALPPPEPAAPPLIPELSATSAGQLTLF